MKEYTKEELLKGLMEDVNLDELADYKKQSGIEKKWEPVMSQPQDDEGSYKARGQEFRSGKASGEHIGHKIIDKSTNEPLVIFYPCDKNIDDFLVEYKDAIESMKQQYGDFYISRDNTIPKCEPRTTAGHKSLYKPSGEQISVDTKVKFETEIKDAEYLKRYLIYPIVKDTLLGDGTVQKHLEKCSIPRIKVSERAHLDRHSKFSNQILTYQTLNFNSYKDVKDFFNSAVRKVQDQQSQEELDFREYHMARQFNRLYQNWDKTKKSSDRFFGFTPIYNLEAYGLSPTSFDVTIWSMFTVKGQIVQAGTETKFEWEVSFKTEHGKKLKDNQQLSRLQINKDYDIKKQILVDLSNFEFSGVEAKDVIAKDENVQNGLKNILNELKSEILQIPVQDQLKRAKLVGFQLSAEDKAEMRRQRQLRLASQSQGEESEVEPEQPLSEEFIDTIVQNILKEIKK